MVTGAKEDGITVRPSGRVETTARELTPEAIATAFQNATVVSKESEAATTGLTEPATAPAEVIKDTDAKPANLPVINESSADVVKQQPELTQKTESDPLKSMLADIKLKKQEEKQKVWTETISAIENNNGENENPYFVTYESNGQKTLTFIKPVDGEYVEITPEGPRAVKATEKVQNTYNEYYLNPKTNKLEDMDAIPIPNKDGLARINKAMEESKKTAVEIAGERKELVELDESIVLAGKLKETVSPQQVTTPPTPIV
jgi:hypothetical protein